MSRRIHLQVYVDNQIVSSIEKIAHFEGLSIPEATRKVLTLGVNLLSQGIPEDALAHPPPSPVDLEEPEPDPRAATRERVREARLAVAQAGLLEAQIRRDRCVEGSSARALGDARVAAAEARCARWAK